MINDPVLQAQLAALVAQITQLHDKLQVETAAAAGTRGQQLSEEGAGAETKPTFVLTPNQQQEQFLHAYGLTPARHFASTDAVQEYTTDLYTLINLTNEAGLLYNELNPDSNTTLLAFVALVTAGLAVGAVGAAVGAGSATSGAASAPAISSVGTGAAVATTAGAATAPIVIGTSVGTATAAATSAAATSASVASTVGSAVTSVTGSSAAGAVASTVVGDIGSAITDVEQFISPLTSLISQVLQGIDELNKNIIQPLSDTVLKDYNTISGLVTEVRQLASSGIQGILSIPTALATAFTSLDASNQRFAAALGATNAATAANTLVPGIGGAIANPLGQIHEALTATFSQAVTDVGATTLDRLNEVAFNMDAFNAMLGSNVGAFKGKGLWFDAINTILLMIRPLLTVAGLGESLLHYARQLGSQANPLEPIAPSEAIRGWWRGNLSQAQALLEMQRQGLDSTRAQLLHDLEQWVPPPGDALRMFYRGELTQEGYLAALAKQGFSEDDALALLAAQMRPVNPRELLEAQGVATAMTKGFLASSLGSAASDDQKAAYEAAEESPEQAQLDWLGHWDIQPMSWWLTAFFRGLASQEELNLAAEAHNIPPELWPNLPAVEAEPIQLWMIPDMLATGIFTDEQALAYLKYIGIDANSANFILAYGKSKSKTPLGVVAQTLGGIVAGQAKVMFQDGIITSQQYVDVLTGHGYTEEAATLEVKLVQYEFDVAARRSYAETLISQVLQGLMTEGQFQAQLSAQGYKGAEVARYTQQLQQRYQQTQKKLSNSDVKEFLKAGIFTPDDAYQALQLDGWNSTYAAAFITLWSGSPYAPSATR